MKINKNLFQTFGVVVLLALNVNVCFCQKKISGKDKSQISLVLQNQLNSWNNGNLETFMEGYWKNDSLKFIGKSGVTYGWKPTLENYKQNYPDKASMGTLSFNLISFEKISSNTVFVIGKWHLKRSIGDLEGHFSLLWRKVNGKWVMIADHSS
jgi:hypothetical protein